MVCNRVETWSLREKRSVKLTMDIGSVSDSIFSELVGSFIILFS